MTIRVVRSADLVRVPWKNGGGTTAEVAAHPAGAGYDGFLWRISLADVAADGPFSRFPDIDRTLVLAEGRDLVLDIEGEAFPLATPGERRSFLGEAATAARLMAGPIRDINVMTRRGRALHRVALLDRETALDAADVVAVAALRDGVTVRLGDWEASLSRLDVALVEGQRLVADGPALAISITVVAAGR